MAKKWKTRLSHHERVCRRVFLREVEKMMRSTNAMVTLSAWGGNIKNPYWFSDSFETLNGSEALSIKLQGIIGAGFGLHPDTVRGVAFWPTKTQNLLYLSHICYPGQVADTEFALEMLGEDYCAKILEKFCLGPSPILSGTSSRMWWANSGFDRFASQSADKALMKIVLGNSVRSYRYSWFAYPLGPGNEAFFDLVIGGQMISAMYENSQTMRGLYADR